MKEKKLALSRIRVQSFVTDSPNLIPERIRGGCGSTQIFCTIVVHGHCCYTCNDKACQPKDDEKTNEQ